MQPKQRTSCYAWLAPDMPVKKLKGRPVFILNELEAGGFEVRIDARNDDPAIPAQHFASEAQAHVWIRDNLDKFSPGLKNEDSRQMRRASLRLKSAA